MARKFKIGSALGAVGLMLVVAGCGGVAGGSSDTVHLRVAVSIPPNGNLSATIQWFMDELEERTDGEVTAEVMYGGALLAGTDTLPGLQQGRAEAGMVIPAYFPAEMPLNNLNMVPVAGADQAARARALQDTADTVPEFADEFSDNGLVLVGYLPSASSTVSLKEASSLADVRGKKLRIPSQPQAAAWKELGAEPVFMPTEEVYEAVERGIVDGVTYPFDTQISTGVSEVAQVLAPDVGQSNGAFLALGQDSYDSLSDDAKEVFDELRAEWHDKADELVMEYEAEACDTFLDAGGEIHLWTEAEQRRIAEAVDKTAVKVWRDEATEAGADPATVDDVWATFEAAVQEHTGASGYVDGLVKCSEQGS